MQVDGWGVICCQDPDAYISSGAEIRLASQISKPSQFSQLTQILLKREEADLAKMYEFHRISENFKEFQRIDRVSKNLISTVVMYQAFSTFLMKFL